MSTFKVGENGIVVSDPCYKIDTWCQGKIGNILSGTYVVEVEYIYGRVSKLIARHSCYPNSNPDIYVPFDIGVDSGTCGIFDYDYYVKHHSPELDEDWYDKNVCDQIDNDHFICDNSGVWSESGWGDGSYSCYVAMDETNENVVSVAIEYISDENEDDDEYCEDEEDM